MSLLYVQSCCGNFWKCCLSWNCMTWQQRLNPAVTSQPELSRVWVLRSHLQLSPAPLWLKWEQQHFRLSCFVQQPSSPPHHQFSSFCVEEGMCTQRQTWSNCVVLQSQWRQGHNDRKYLQQYNYINKSLNKMHSKSVFITKLSRKWHRKHTNVKENDCS